jgi:hypothetical protein
MATQSHIRIIYSTKSSLSNLFGRRKDGFQKRLKELQLERGHGAIAYAVPGAVAL